MIDTGMNRAVRYMSGIQAMADKSERQLRKYLCKQLDRAVLGLVRAHYDPSRGVHACRRALKQARTVLRIIKPEMGGVAAAASTLCRDIGRKLSTSRDIQVIYQTWHDVCDQHAVDTEVAETIATALEDRHSAVAREIGELDNLAVQLSLLQDQLMAAWAVDKADTLYHRRLTRFADNTMKRWAEAQQADDWASLHEVRKQAKDWMHAMRVVRASWTRRDKKLHRELVAFTEALGRVNDATVLLHWLEYEAPAELPKRDSAKDYVTSYRQQLLVSAQEAAQDFRTEVHA